MNIPRRSISLLSLSLLIRNNLKDRGTYYKYRWSAVFFYAIDTVLILLRPISFNLAVNSSCLDRYKWE